MLIKKLLRIKRYGTLAWLQILIESYTSLDITIKRMPIYNLLKISIEPRSSVFLLVEIIERDTRYRSCSPHRHSRWSLTQRIRKLGILFLSRIRRRTIREPEIREFETHSLEETLIETEPDTARAEVGAGDDFRARVPDVGVGRYVHALFYVAGVPGALIVRGAGEADVRVRIRRLRRKLGSSCIRESWWNRLGIRSLRWMRGLRVSRRSRT